MSHPRNPTLYCPICKKPVKISSAEFPFCSPRCRLLDLGKWASGGYVVSSPVQDTSDAMEESSRESDDES